MAVRFSAANQRYITGGFTGGVTTILCWARIATDTNASADIWVLYNGTETTTEAGLGTSADGTSMLLFDTTTTMAGPNMVVGTWYCFAAVLNGTSYTLYYGTDPQALTTVGPSTRVAVTSPASMTLSHAVEPWNGNIAAFKQYTTALSLADIQNELSQYQPVTSTGMVRYYPFVNAELVDYSGNGNSLTAGAGTATTEPGPPIRWEGQAGQQQEFHALAGATSVNAGSASIGLAAQNATPTTAHQVGSSPTPLAAYSFDDTSGPILDRTGNGHDWALGGSAIRSVSGHTGGGLATDGGGTTATLASPAFGQSSNRTLSMWMIAPANTTQWVVRWNVNSLGSGAWGFLLLGTEVSVQARNASTFERATCTRPTDGLWHHYAATWDNATHALSFYLDGVLTQTNTLLTAPLRTDADTIDIGEWTSTSTVIDDLRIYDSALTASQIQHLAGEPVPPDLTARVGWVAHNASVSTSKSVQAGTAGVNTSQNPGDVTAKVSPSSGVATWSPTARDATTSTGGNVLPAAGNAAVGWTTTGATIKVSPVVGAATVAWTARQAAVENGTIPSPTAATWALAANNAQAKILVNAGLASIGWVATSVISGNQQLACANLSTAIVVDELFAVVGVGDRHSALVTSDALTASVGVDELYATTGVCGRS